MAQLQKYLHLSEISNEKTYVFDIVVENERGSNFFGIPLFSKNFLIHGVDPSSFSKSNNTKKKLFHNKNTQQQVLADYTTCGPGSKNHRFNLKLITLPDQSWEWSWKEWYVLKINDDVDENGWLYSRIRFNSKKWRGSHHFGNFVRKRYWARLREK
ncbi:Spo73p ASCRUDRAFT_38510, partial [Ascoidea rubescens DSM 1968]